MPSVVEERPIKTNSRIVKEEKYRKDMYLAFVRNALIQKSMV
jgi:RNA polymerase I-specific transcription initiation factor RRN3